MKKVILLLTVISILFAFSNNALAAKEIQSKTDNTEIIYLEDGSYIETVITVEENDFSVFATNTTTSTKKITYTNSDGETSWTATLKGTFTYTGSNSTCTSSSITYSITNTKWKIPTATASKSSNKAIGNVTAKYYFLGIPTKTVEETITLTCSATGVLS